MPHTATPLYRKPLDIQVGRRMEIHVTHQLIDRLEQWVQTQGQLPDVGDVSTAALMERALKKRAADITRAIVSLLRVLEPAECPVMDMEVQDAFDGLRKLVARGR